LCASLKWVFAARRKQKRALSSLQLTVCSFFNPKRLDISLSKKRYETTLKGFELEIDQRIFISKEFALKIY
jgi:hypothetical protein